MASYSKKICIVLICILLINIAPSQQQLKLPGKLSLPFAGVLDPTIFVKITEGLKDVAVGVQRKDFLIIGIKFLEIIRCLLKIVNLPGFRELDAILEMLHGVGESVHPIMNKMKANARIVANEETARGSALMGELHTDQSVMSSLQEGFKMIGFIPKMIQNVRQVIM